MTYTQAILVATMLLGCSVASAQLNVHGIDWFPKPEYIVASFDEWQTVPGDAGTLRVDYPTNADAEPLLARKSLVELTLFQREFDANNPLELVGKLSALPKLRFLGIWGFTGNIALMKALAKLPHIEVLVFFHLNPVVPTGLAELKNCQSLRALYVNAYAGDTVSALDLPHLESLSQLAELEHLALHCNWFSQPTILRDERGVPLRKRRSEAFLPLARLKKLKGLTLEGVEVSDELLAKLAGLPELALLSLFRCDGLDAKSLAKLATCKKLEVLDIGDPFRPDLAAVAFDELSNLTSLRVLWLQGRRQITAEQLSQLITASPALAELRLHGSVLSGEVVGMLGISPRFERLTLDLSSLGDPPALERLHKIQSLRELTIIGTDNRVGQSAICWEQMVALHTLRLLPLRGKREILESLVNAPKLTTLELRIGALNAISTHDLIATIKNSAITSLVLHKEDWSEDVQTELAKNVKPQLHFVD